MASVSTASLLKGWREKKRGQKVAYAKAQHQGARFGNKAVGEIKVTSTGLRHSFEDFSGPMKDALLCDTKAMQRSLWNGKSEVLKSTKKHVGITFGITSKVKVDGKVCEVQFIIHKHKQTGDNNLYHVRLKQ